MTFIITDTTSCVPEEFAKEHAIPVIPQIINFGNQSYYENVDIDFDTFMMRLKSSKELPKTAAPPPEQFAVEFERLVPYGQTILCIHPSQDVSGNVRSATIAARDFPEADIRVIDTRVIASALGTMVMQAVKWAEADVDASEIVSRLAEMTRRSRIYFMVDSMEFLAKGGRIGGATALVGSLLQIKPILTFRDGQVDQYERERTQKRAMNHIKQLVLDQMDRDGNGFLTVMHAGIQEQAREFASDLAEKLGADSIPLANMPPAIVTHGGPGILGVSFFSKQ